jgi:hypothetical protein
MEMTDQVGTVVGMDQPSMSEHHKGGAMDADVSAADVELAAMAARPSNVAVIVVAVFAAISLACTISAAASPTWATAGVPGFGSHIQAGLFEACSVSMSSATTPSEVEPCWTGGDVKPVFKPPFELYTCTKYTQVTDKPQLKTYKADNEYVRGVPRAANFSPPSLFLVLRLRPSSPSAFITAPPPPQPDDLRVLHIRP